MDSIIIGIKTLLGFSAARVGFLVWGVLFLLVIMFSILIATVPDRKLYSAGRDGARKVPLRMILESYKKHPDRWLLYEEEIFYVRDPDSLEGEALEAYERARVRCVNGGAEARRVGSRVRLGRPDAQAYLKFFYGLHRERGPLPRRRRKEAPAAARREEIAEREGDGESLEQTVEE